MVVMRGRWANDGYHGYNEMHAVRVLQKVTTYRRLMLLPSRRFLEQQTKIFTRFRDDWCRLL
jgi:hypothetical protein